MDSIFPAKLSDLELIEKIQDQAQSDPCLKELVQRHSGIYINMIHNYVPSNTIFTNKDELISDKEYNIYQAALKFDSSRGAKFSTYLGNETKWMCLNIYNKNKKHPEIATEELYLDLNQDFSTNDHEKNIERELFKKIMELLKDYPDSRISQIFSMRYVEGSKNKVMPWKEVSQKIDMSIQGCINIHDATVQKLKIKLKEI